MVEMCNICDAEENASDDTESVKSLRRNDDVSHRQNVKKTTKKKMQSFLSFPHHDTKNLKNCVEEDDDEQYLTNFVDLKIHMMNMNDFVGLDLDFDYA